MEHAIRVPTPPLLDSRFHGNDIPYRVIPAKAGIQGCGVRRNIMSASLRKR